MHRFEDELHDNLIFHPVLRVLFLPDEKPDHEIRLRRILDRGLLGSGLYRCEAHARGCLLGDGPRPAGSDRWFGRVDRTWCGDRDRDVPLAQGLACEEAGFSLDMMIVGTYR